MNNTPGRIEARDRSPEPLFSCCSYAQPIHRPLETDQDRIVNPRYPAGVGAAFCVSVSQQSVVSSAERYNSDSTPVQCRLSLRRLGNSIGGVHERIKYAGFEAKKAPNRNDEAEGSETEIH